MALQITRNPSYFEVGKGWELFPVRSIKDEISQEMKLSAQGQSREGFPSLPNHPSKDALDRAFFGA
jgi:hypothetical protein